MYHDQLPVHFLGAGSKEFVAQVVTQSVVCEIGAHCLLRGFQKAFQGQRSMGLSGAISTFDPNAFRFLPGEHCDHLVEKLDKGLMGIEAFPLDLSLVYQLLGNDSVVFLVNIEVLTVSLSRHDTEPPLQITAGPGHRPISSPCGA